MPALTGIEALRALRARGDRTPMILLTTFDDSAGVARSGAKRARRDSCSRTPRPKTCARASCSVQKGESLLQPVATDPVRERFAYRETSAPQGAFTEREIGILRLLAGGYSNKEIARSLFLAEGTVKNYVSDILDKLDARDRTRAVLKAITLRII